ncbi:unnamed protein product [Paramecium sonneborni]|uniref:Uncharacterized protein n=1 Tax=Paramecium sonneborni TaxID=65129 RepID=A0A8S1KLE3_9CILI|nr:unnamed protein product [Paramecium sonneborni]
MIFDKKSTLEKQETKGVKDQNIIQNQNNCCCEAQFRNNKQDPQKYYKGQIWNSQKARFEQIQFKIEIMLDNKIKYTLSNGSIIELNDFNDPEMKIQELVNLEQIKYLRWQGKYGENQQKIGKWIALWKGERIFDSGGYYCKDGFKQGQWKELIKNYSSQNKAFEIGEYFNGYKIGTWQQIFEDQVIGNGFYDDSGLKTSKWIEQDYYFWKFYQVIQQGEYKFGLKIGRWDIFHRTENDKPYEKIGGGYYDQQVDQQNSEIKKGFWIEVGKGLFMYDLVTFNGEYQYGKKVGKWTTHIRNHNFSYEKIGGGYYDNHQEGHKSLDVDIKTGKWIEWNEDHSWVIYEGEYKNGLKVGLWNTFYKCDSTTPFYMIGGGLYKIDIEKGSIKTGMWIELSIDFQWDNITIYQGEYKNGLKIGRWEIFQRLDILKNYEMIGGGQYQGDDDGFNNGIKTGKWVDLSDKYGLITYYGGYKNGKKIGKWDIFQKLYDLNELIGGGQYSDIKQGHCDNGIKIGKWIELHDGFWSELQVTFVGEYVNGKKIGQWDTYFKENQQYIKIGGGQYVYQQNFWDCDYQATKIGKWIELNDGFWRLNQVTCIGEYKNGIKVGRWNDYQKDFKNGDIQQIGGGLYEESHKSNNQIISIKQGIWIELSNNYDYESQLTYKGEYKNGYKIGIWETFQRFYDQEWKIEQIGGGQYEEIKLDDELFSIKIGKWIEISNEFKNWNQKIYNGEYRDGKKFGVWYEMRRDEKQLKQGFQKNMQIKYQ